MENALVHGEGLLVPERMIVAPSVGVFRPLVRTEDVEGHLVDAGQAIGVVEGPGVSTPVRSPFRGMLVGMLAATVSACAGRARRLAAGRRLIMRAGITRSRHRASPSSGSRTPTSRRASTPATAGSSSAPASASAASRRPTRPPRRSRIEAGTAAIKHAGITPDEIDLLIVATATPEQPIPHTGAFVGEGLGLRCGSFDLQAGVRRASSTSSWSGSSLLTPAGSTTSSLIGAETLSRIVDPQDRGTCILFGDGAAGVVLSRVGRRAPRPPRLGPRLRRVGDRAARDPRRREPPARDARDDRGRRAVPEDAGPRGVPPRRPRGRRLGDRRRSSAPAWPPTTSTGSCRTRPTCASSSRRRNGSASRRSARS